MTYLCPTCRTPLDDARVSVNGHAFAANAGVLARHCHGVFHHA